MQMRHVIEYNGETAEFYIDFRDGKCLVLNVDSGVWKIYDNAILGLEADQELSNNIKNTIYEDGLFYDTKELECIPDTDKFALLILEVTDACNMKCDYCFEGKKEHCHTYMKTETACKAFELFSQLNCSERIMVEFNGGEALLNFDMIKSSVTQILEYAKNKKINVDFTLQSNGTMLNKDIIDFLKRYDIPIGISMDGGEKYNIGRKLKNGDKVYPLLLDKISMLKKQGKDFCTLSVVTKSGQYKDILGLQKRIGNIECRINLINKVGNGADISLTSNEISNIANDFLAFAKEVIHEKTLYEANLACYLMGLMLFNPFMCYKTPCGSGKNQLYVKADGTVVACQESCYINEGFIGNVSDMDIETLKQGIRKNEWINSTDKYKDREKCQKCQWKKICHVCPAIMKVDETMCEFNKLVLPELVWLTGGNENEILSYIQYK